MQLKQENSYLTTIARQISPYILSIAKVKERLEPRCGNLRVVTAPFCLVFCPVIVFLCSRLSDYSGFRSLRSTSMTALKQCWKSMKTAPWPWRRARTGVGFYSSQLFLLSKTSNFRARKSGKNSPISKDFIIIIFKGLTIKEEYFGLYWSQICFFSSIELYWFLLSWKQYVYRRRLGPWEKNLTLFSEFKWEFWLNTEFWL